MRVEIPVTIYTGLGQTARVLGAKGNSNRLLFPTESIATPSILRYLISLHNIYLCWRKVAWRFLSFIDILLSLRIEDITEVISTRAVFFMYTLHSIFMMNSPNTAQSPRDLSRLVVHGLKSVFGGCVKIARVLSTLDNGQTVGTEYYRRSIELIIGTVAFRLIVEQEFSLSRPFTSFSS